MQGILTRKIREMNTLILTTALMAATFFYGESATVTTEVKQKIKQTISLLDVNLPLEANQQGLVRASLKVDENGKLQIVEANYSHKELRDLLEKELANIDLEGQTTNEVFFYEFHFEKH
jgi:hypothetical protein